MTWFDRIRRKLGRHDAGGEGVRPLSGVDRVFAELTGGPGQTPIRRLAEETVREEPAAAPPPGRRETVLDEEPEAVVRVTAEDPSERDLDLDAYELREMRRLYAEVVGGQLVPLKALVAFLRRLPMSVDWARAARPSVRLATRSADDLGLVELCPLLGLLEEQLERCESVTEDLIDGPPREGFLRAYADLEAVFPEAFEVDDDEGDASLVLYGELRAIPGLDLSEVDRVYEAGLTDLGDFEYASPGDLAVATGLDESAAERIWRRVQTLRESASRSAAPPARGPGCPRCTQPLGVELGAGAAARVRCARCRSWVRLEPDPGGGLTIAVEGAESVPETPYEVLGVSERDSLDVIRRAYRRRIVAYHPDKVAQLGSELRAVAEAKTRELNLAMEAVERARTR